MENPANKTTITPLLSNDYDYSVQSAIAPTLKTYLKALK